MRLLVYAENGRDYLASVHPPSKYKKKAVYFLKREPCALTAENIADAILHGDVSDAPLESLSQVTKQVFLPLLTSPHNQVGWPEFLSKEVSEALHKFTANVYVAIGQIKGQTMLPLPAGVQQSTCFLLCSSASTYPCWLSLHLKQTQGNICSDIDKLDPEQVALAEDHDKIHILESCVVTWTKQIKNVLKADPDEPLKSGLHPGPETELDFWKERANNLKSVHEQLEGEGVQKSVNLLRLSRSTYYSAYLRLADEVEKAMTQAIDNVNFLAPLRPRLEKILFRCAHR
jgi:dynein heavy chain, axonemal